MPIRQKSRGLFITFEGGEGSGKSLQIRGLSTYLKRQGFPVLVSCEPGGTLIGREIRKLLLNPRFNKMGSRTELLLYEADRAQHVDELILPALRAGKIVISDRYADSTTVYQGFCRGMGMGRTAGLNVFATTGLLPDLVVVLDVPVVVGLGRIRGRRGLDRLEREKKAFHEQVRKGFLTLAKNDPRRIKVVDGTESVDEVGYAIRSLVEKKLRRRGLWKRR